MARADRRRAQRARPAAAARRSDVVIEDTMFFPRLRRHAKWMFLFLALVVRARLRRLRRRRRRRSASATSSATRRAVAGRRRSPTPSSACSTTRRTRRRSRISRPHTRRTGNTDDAIEALQSYVAASPEGHGRAPRARRALPAAGVRRRRSARRSTRYAPTTSRPGTIRDTIFQLGGSPLTPDPITNAVSTAYEREISAAASEIQTASAQAVEQYRKIARAPAERPDRPARARSGRAVGERHRDDDRGVQGVPQARTGRPDRTGGPRASSSSCSSSAAAFAGSDRLRARLDSPPVRPVLLVAARVCRSTGARRSRAAAPAGTRARAARAPARSSSSRRAAAATRSPTPARTGRSGRTSTTRSRRRARPG